MKRYIYKFIAFASALVLVCAGFSGCSKTVKDAEIRLPLAAEPLTLDPQIAQSAESKTVTANCFEGLTKLDESGNAVPAAANAVSVSTDGLVYQFTLHQDKKWHINSNHEALFGENWETAIDLRVTAADFVFGLQRALAPETKAPDAQRLYMIKNAEKVHKGELPVSQLGVEAVDEFTVRITLEYASSEFLSVLADPIAMPCKQAFFEATGGRHGLGAEYILCNGSFYLSRWYKGTNILLRRNADNPQAQAKIYSVTYAFTQDPEVILEKLSDGSYAAAAITPDMISTLESKGCTVKEFQNTVWGLAFNCADETVSSTKLRLALIRTVDFNEISALAGDEMSDSATGIIPPSCLLDGVSYAKRAPSVGLLSYDEATAKKYFDEYSNGNLCEVSVLCTQQYETAIRRIIQNWQQIFGINLSAKVEVLEEAELESRVQSGNYQCALSSISTSAQTPTQFLTGFASGTNICRLNSESFNTLIKQLNMASGQSNVIEGCTKAQQFIIQNGIFCPLFFKSSYCAVSQSAENVLFSHSGTIINFSEAEILKN